jgi:hypothetical protein
MPPYPQLAPNRPADSVGIAARAGPAGAFWASDRLRCFKENIAGTTIRIVAEQLVEQGHGSLLLGE